MRAPFCIAAPIAVVGVFTVAAVAQPIVIIDNLSGTFINIAGPPSIELNPGDDGSVTVPTTTGNFVFNPGTVTISNNGGVAFNASGNPPLDPVNQPLPEGSDPMFGGEQAVAVMWDDIGNHTGRIWFRQFTDKFIIQWEVFFKNANGTAQDTIPSIFQIQVFDPPLTTLVNEVVAQMLYQRVEFPRFSVGGARSTIGYQDGIGGEFNNFQWSFNEPSVENGTVLSILVDPQRPCRADFNGDCFLDFFDFAAYVECFETGQCPPGRTADFNGDGFVDFFDLDRFVAEFERGCGR